MKEFIMLVGLPGSGKSTYAKDHFTDNTKYVGSDAVRAELYGDESIQGNPAEVFKVMLQKTTEALQCDDVRVIYDATNIKKKHRLATLMQLPKDIIKRCVIVWAPYDTCVLRDSLRSRVCGEEVIKQMIMNFEVPTYDEGWSIIQRHVSDSEHLFGVIDVDLDIPHDNPHHNNTIEEHIHNVTNEVNLLYMLDKVDYVTFEILHDVARFHDIGKPFTKTFTNLRGETTEVAHYYGHHNVSAYLYVGYPCYFTTREVEIASIINMHMMKFLNPRGINKLTARQQYLLNLFVECDVE